MTIRVVLELTYETKPEYYDGKATTAEEMARFDFGRDPLMLLEQAKTANILSAEEATCQKGDE